MRHVLGILVALGGTASAAPITPPAGWKLDPSLATPPSGTRFGGLTVKIGVAAYRAPAPGAVLYFERAEATVPAARRDAIASAELEELRTAMRRQGPTATVELDVQRYVPASKWLEAAVTWRDASLGIVDQSLILIAADATRTVAVTGKCVLAVDVSAEHAKACQSALATLDPEVPLADRVPLAIVHDPVAAAPIDPAPADSTKMSGAPELGPPATLEDGRRMVLPPIEVASPRREVDRRPVYVGGGLVLLAALFYMSRRRREKLEREDDARPPGRGATPPPAARDPDGDDLHAAAASSDDGSHDER